MAFLRILTLNTWCPPQAQHRPQRALAIANQINLLNPDVVCLQEMFLQKPRDILINTLKANYPHYQYFSSGLLGSGLLTMAKYPIVDSHFHQFQLRGKPEKIQHGDYYVAKGIALTRIKTPQGMLDVYNTHTHAQYEPQNDNEYAVFNHTNLYEIARFIFNQSSDHPVALCGDLNTRPDQLGYRLIQQFTRMTDTYTHLHPNEHGYTFAKANPYVKDDNQRLDYIFVNHRLKPTVADMTFTEPIATPPALAFSDHYGLMTDIAFETWEVSPKIHQTETILRSLMVELERESGLTQAQQTHHFEQAGLGTFALVDTQFTGRIFRKHFPKLAELINKFVLITTTIYTVYHLMNAFLNLRPRENTLRTIQQEIEIQLHAKRLYNGEEW